MKTITVFSPELMRKRIDWSGITLREIQHRTKLIDPHGKGVNQMTIHRMLKGADPKASTISLVCAALGISPRSCFENIEL